MFFTFSKAEHALFKAFESEYVFNEATHPSKGNLPPAKVYNLMVDRVFKLELQGPHVDALRRAVTALDDASPSRGTPEFDALLDFTPSRSDMIEALVQDLETWSWFELVEALKGHLALELEGFSATELTLVYATFVEAQKTITTQRRKGVSPPCASREVQSLD